jgi:hypothetical protein
LSLYRSKGRHSEGATALQQGAGEAPEDVEAHAAVSPAPRQSSVRPEGWTLTALAGLVLPLVALALGIYSLTTARQSAVGPYGLIQALPADYFLALAILGASFIMTWTSSRRWRLPFALSAAALVVLLDGAPGLIESEPRFESAWLTAGFTDYIAKTGHVLPLLDARFSWPSFFTGVAIVARAGGLPSAILLLRWWLVFINLMCLPPLYLIAKQILRDEKKAALAVFLFPIANWVGQDYYSPQSVAFFLYLVVVAIVIGPFGLERKVLLPPALARLRRRESAAESPPPTAAQSPHPAFSYSDIVTLLGVLLLLCAAIVTGHQLSPFFTVATLAVLAFVGRTRLVAWPGIMLLLTLGWVCYATISYWSGHFSTIFGAIGGVGSNVSEDLRLHGGTAAHHHVDDVRLAMAGIVLLLAIAGFFMARNANIDRRSGLVLTLTPLVVITGQPYGGEAGLRAFLFTLPGALCLMAFALTRAARATRVVVTGLVIAAMMLGFLVARWGNELSEEVLPAEITGMTYLYNHATPGAKIMAIDPQVSWEFEDVGRFTYTAYYIDIYGFGFPRGGSVPALADSRGGYLVVTRSQLVFAEQNYGVAAGWGTSIERRLIQSGHFKLMYKNADTSVYRYVIHSGT